MKTHPNAIQLNPGDNVAVALRQLNIGDHISNTAARASEPIARGHKVAIHPIQANEAVMKYGQTIGVASQAIAAGSHVHTHNLSMHHLNRDHQTIGTSTPLPPIAESRTFQGYHRADGRVGTRNYIGIVTTVNCSGSVAHFIAQAANQAGFLDAYPNIDGIVPIAHNTGCGMAANGDGYDTLMRTLAGYADHPNFGGTLLLGLGCEVMQPAELTSSNTDRNPSEHNHLARQLTIQQEGGTRKTVAAGLDLLHEIADIANRSSRAPAPVSALTLGLNCGGSDGYSGITANPALGIASDLLVQHGGCSILSETPEIYGAEHLLTRRATSHTVSQKLLDCLAWWEDYCRRNGNEMDNNPSPGNKQGGLTTILEKSLGAVAKSGTSPLIDVYRYAEKIRGNGFVYMDSPGFDPCSVTGQIAAGANLVAFTTGRGSVSGFKPTPCIKLATNTDMFTNMVDDMDINTGDIIDEGISVQAKGAEIFDLLVETASGRLTKSEQQGFGDVEFVPWQIGAVM